MYEDAQRRKTDLEVKKKQIEKERMTGKEPKFVNDKSDQYVIKKFDKELKQAEQDLLQEEGYENSEEKKREAQVTGEKRLDFDNMCKLINMLGFLPVNRQPEEKDQQLCQDLWTLLHGDRFRGVAIGNLRLALLNCIGIRIADREVKAEQNNETQQNETVDNETGEITTDKTRLELDNVGQYDDEGKLFLKRGEHKKIFTHFKNLYINRVQHIGAQKKHSPAFVDTTSRDSHKPQISEKTQALA